MRSLAFSLLGVCTLLIAPAARAEDTKTYQLKGTNPGGSGGYTGTVEVRKQGETFAIRWITGAKHEETIGFGLAGDSTIGAGYGGEALYSIAVYELKGKTIHAKWALTSKPGEAGEYDLKGSPAFSGVYKFADGAPGTVTMTPTKGDTYRMVWDLSVGHYEGIGVKLGNSLVAVAGDPSKLIGVAGYKQKGDDLDGLWTTNGSAGAGHEYWSAGGESAAAPAPAAAAPTDVVSVAKDGKSISFDTEVYAMKNNKSDDSGSQPTVELREFLRPNEDWDGYSKLLGLRMMSKSLKADAASFARGTMAQTKKDFPTATTEEISMKPDHAVFTFTISSGADQEYNLWDYRKTPRGIVTAQFVLRNKGAYQDAAKFADEIKTRRALWVAQLGVMAEQAEAAIKATKGLPEDGGVAATAKSPAAPGGKDIPPELVDAIQADLQKCGGVGEKFIGLLKAGDVPGAVAVMSDRAFAKMTRAQFTAGLTESNKQLGGLKSFKPDPAGTDFGVVNGLMTFTLKADADYANGAVKETLRFVRNDRGEVEMIDYNRAPK